MSEIEKIVEENAFIIDVSLEYDAGNNALVPYVLLLVDEGKGKQAFGGLAYLNSTSPNLWDFIQQMLVLFKVNKWESLKGLPARVKRTNNRVTSIGHFVENTWVDLDELL